MKNVIAAMLAGLVLGAGASLLLLQWVFSDTEWDTRISKLNEIKYKQAMLVALDDNHIDKVRQFFAYEINADILFLAHQRDANELPFGTSEILETIATYRNHPDYVEYAIYAGYDEPGDPRVKAILAKYER